MRRLLDHLLIPLLSAVIGLGMASSTSDQSSFQAFSPSTIVKSTNLTDKVQWDGYSLFVEGERIVLWSAEVHPFRLPVPGLWPDIMQKIRALGLNAVSFYTFWGLHNPSPGVLDFDGWKDIQPFIDAAHDAGLWLLARPGPYINGEITGGGIPGWVTALNVSLRTSDPGFREAYTPYWKKIGQIIAENQISTGGPIIAVQIENEYYLNAAGDIDTTYIQQLESSLRDSGVAVPFFSNDASEEGRLVSGPGAVDIYGFDSYPQSSDTVNPSIWPYQVDETYRPFFQETSGQAGTPFFIPEFQAGTTPTVGMEGFDQGLPLYSSEFEKVYYLNNLAQGIKMVNFYMVFGGTNFGHTAFPRAITSYDYYAAISEDRSLQEPKYSELKLLSHFVRSARSLPKTWIVGSSNVSYTTLPGVIQVDELRNPDEHAGFYIVRHANSSSIDTTSFSLSISSGDNQVDLPMILRGRDSRVVVSNYRWGNSTIAYCSASIFTATTIGDEDVLVLYGETGDDLQIGFSTANVEMEQLEGSATVSLQTTNGPSVLQAQLHGPDHSVIRVRDASSTIVLHLLDTRTAYTAWEPVIESQDCSTYYRAGSSETALVFGPHLVRSSVDEGGVLHLTGDVNTTTTISVVSDPRFTQIMWNNETLQVTRIPGGMWVGSIDAPTQSSKPTLSEWTAADSLPECKVEFDDSMWITANSTPSVNPNKVYDGYSGSANLYLPDYGFYVGHTILRGHFTGSGSETGLNVSLSPGTSGVGAVWLNGEWLGSAVVPSTAGVEDVNVTFAFPSDSLQAGSDNVITVLLDNAGLEETDQFSGTPDDIKSPRGIRGYTLIGGDEVEWRMQGNLGGNTDFPDKVRGLYNVGGLYGEREGWYLPGYDNSHWNSTSSASDPGVLFCRASLSVDIPSGMDVHHSVVFPATTGPYRAQLYVNGWQFGRWYGDLGPQTKFPIPPGILRSGTNTLAISVFTFNTIATGTSIVTELSVEVDSYTASSLDLTSIAVESPTWPELFQASG